MSAGFRLGVLGPLSVSVGGAEVGLPKSKKTRALLAHLALAGEPVRRERLCELFWDLPDDPRGSLRWSLSKLRPIVNADGVERLAADGEAVAWAGSPDELDLRVVERGLAQGAGRLSSHELASLAALFRGELADGLDLPEHESYQRGLAAERERVRRLRTSILCLLIERLAHDPAAALPHANALVELSPYDEEAHARLIELHRRLLRDKEARQAYDAGVRALREVGRSSAALDAAWRASAPKAAKAPEPSPPADARAAAPETTPLSQEIRFCRAADGVSIAYAVVGQGPPLVKTSNWLNHLEYDWESPVWRHVFRAFAREHTFIRYDERGNGLSDWNTSDVSFEAMVADLEAVVDAAGVERFPLFGCSQGCAVSIEYAVRHPERVSKLVLYGGYARGWRLGTSPRFIAETEAVMSLMRIGWGRDNPAFRQIFTTFFMPEATPEQIAWFNELQRMTTTGDVAIRLMETFGTIDVSHRLALVRAPTLVLHVRDDQRVSFSRGREIAAGIPGARFVPLEGRNHLILEHEPAWPRFWDEVSRFLAEA